MAKKTSAQIVAGVGAGLAAATAAGYYFYASSRAKNHRKIAARWASAMKNEVIRDVKKLKDRVTARDIALIVDSVATAYAGTRSKTAEAVKSAAAELKRNWEQVRDESFGTRQYAPARIKASHAKAAKARKRTKRRVPTRTRPRR
jgi:hypothetical protein